MSGSSGGLHQSDDFLLGISSTMTVEFLTPEEEERYHAMESQPYRRWVERCLPGVEALLQRARAERALPLVVLPEDQRPLQQARITSAPGRSHEIDRLTEARSEGRVQFFIELDDRSEAWLVVAASSPLSPADMEWLGESAQAVLLAFQAEPRP